MNHWFGQEGLLQTVFEKIWNLTVLNICFVVSCLPVVTVGAALTALSSVNLRMLRREEGRVAADYWKAFRQNFRQSTGTWLLLLAAGGLFAVDFWALSQLGGMAVFVLKVLLGALFVVYLAVLHYIFAYIARFSDSLWVGLKNALMLSGANLLPTASMLCITFLVLFVSLYSLEVFLRAIYLWTLLGFAALNYAHCFLLNRILARYE